LIDGSPQVMLLTRNLHKDLVDEPIVAKSAFTPFERTLVAGSKLQTLAAYRFVGHFNAALGEGIFHVSEAQREATVEPDGVTDDLGRISMAAISGFSCFHGHRMPESRLM